MKLNQLGRLEIGDKDALREMLEHLEEAGYHYLMGKDTCVYLYEEVA